MTKQECEALLVLVPGVFIRAGVRCPHCRKSMHAEPQRRVNAALIDWNYECERCGTVLDSNLKVIKRLAIWNWSLEARIC